MSIDPDIRDLIDHVVRDRLAHDQIEKVEVDEETDEDGDPVLYITIVFGIKGPLAPEKTASITRYIRHKLLERNEEIFPVLTFMSKADAESKTAAA